jgi:hypothetical protein
VTVEVTSRRQGGAELASRSIDRDELAAARRSPAHRSDRRRCLATCDGREPLSREGDSVRRRRASVVMLANPPVMVMVMVVVPTRQHF